MTLNRLTEAELAIAERVYTGRIACELGLALRRDTRYGKNPRFFNGPPVSSSNFHMHWRRGASRTGVIRLEDRTC